MGRSAWETELEASSSKRSGGRRLGRFFVAVLFVGVATFVGAYYVPLLRAHRALTRLYAPTKERAEAAQRRVTQLEAELQTTVTERDEIREQEHKRDTDAQSGRQRVDALGRELSENLKKHVDKGRLTLSTRGDRVHLGTSRGTLFVTGKDDVSPQGTLLLCDIAKAAGAHPLRVAASMAGGTEAASGPAWESQATAAARAAQALADRCAVPSARLSLAVVAGDEPSHAGAHGMSPDLVIVGIRAEESP